MVKTEPVTGVKPAADAVNSGDAAIPLTLHEFCSRLSSKITKPELIAGFEYAERVAGHASDTHDAFAERFDKFVKQPA